jgi:hypothetical protein
MYDHFRALAVHHAKVHKTFLETWRDAVPDDRIDVVVDDLVYDGIWLTKFPLLTTPRFGIGRLDALDKGRRTGADRARWAAEAAALVPLVDADVLRFVLGLNADVLDQKIEIFFGGRAMNKPLWNYLAAWFEQDAVRRARWGRTPDLLETVFR